MSVEERVERIKAEIAAEKQRKSLLMEERKTEFTTHTRYINARLEELRKLKVVEVIEEFTRFKVRPVFIVGDLDTAEKEVIPGPNRWPTKEEFRLSLHEMDNPKARNFWSSQVLPPSLNNESLEWDTNLRLKINNFQTGTDRLTRSQFDNRPVAWVDLTWYTGSNTLTVEGRELTFSELVNSYELPNLDQLEESLAQAIVNPKKESTRIRPFDMHTPIGAL